MENSLQYKFAYSLQSIGTIRLRTGDMVANSCFQPLVLLSILSMPLLLDLFSPIFFNAQIDCKCEYGSMSFQFDTYSVVVINLFSTTNSNAVIRIEPAMVLHYVYSLWLSRPLPLIPSLSLSLLCAGWRHQHCTQSNKVRSDSFCARTAWRITSIIW